MQRTNISLVLSLAGLALFAPAARSSSPDSLTFFNNWFVTGDYAVAGVGLRGTGVNGLATGKIKMTGLPSGAQPIAAFLYWSTVENTSTPGGSIGYFNTNKIQGAVLGNPQSPNAACSSGGGTAAYGFVYRADVLRYLPVDSNNIPQANGAQTVALPDAGAGKGIYTNGASLVVIYKIVTPGLPYIMPLRAVVIYDGAYTMDSRTAGMTLNVAGMYQAAPAGAGKVTNVVANGQPGFYSPLYINGQELDTNLFEGAQGARWDNPTININLPANASSFSTLATAGTSQTCLTWAAVVASVNVQDSDGDGLLDIWETQGLHRNTSVFPATFGTCAQFPSEPCVNLPAMGANPNKKDIFIQMDWMHCTSPPKFGSTCGTDGTGGTDNLGTHDHIPPLSSLSAVAGSFAPHQINVHFDVGSNYQGAQSLCGNAPCSFIVPATYAQGGHDDDESTLVCKTTNTHTCDYPVPYPVLSFVYGFASIRDGNSLLGISAHFAQNRKDAFHYMLFAHALGGPYDQNGNPINPFTLGPATAPLSYSGIAHRPGGGFMVTFGLWRSDNPAYDQVGSPPQVAQTIQHELGHNLGLGHAGTQTQPNCMPNYQSIMNYSYQILGLTDASGNEHTDYSYGLLLPLSEDFLNTSIPMALPGLQQYKVRYFGPLAPNQPLSQASKVYCDGFPVANGATPEVKLQGAKVSTPDWSNGNVPMGHPIPPADINYDAAKIGQLFLDQPDWFILNLQQIGSGYSFGGLSVGSIATASGAYATDGGALATDAGALATDGGAFATDGGAFATDGGAFATDGGAFATDGGALATDGGALATDAGELSGATVLCSGNAAPTQVTASLGTNQNGIGNSVVVTLTPPSGNNLTYNVYRCVGAGCTPSAPVFKSIAPGQWKLTMLPNGNSTVHFTADIVNDTTHGGTACPVGDTCPNTTYVYAVTAESTLQCGTAAPSTVESSLSNTTSGEVPEQFVVPTGATVTYDGNQHTVAFQIYGDASGALTPAQVTCTTVRNANTYQVSANAGPSQITCSNATPPTPSTEGVVYVASGASYTDGAGVHTGGTLTINKLPITVTAVASTKVYDGTTNPQPGKIPTFTPALGYSDTPNFTESYDNPNVQMGATHTMAPSGTVNDGNFGDNYTIKFVSVNTGIITPAPLTVTVTGSQTYGGTNIVYVPSYSGLVGGDSSSVVTGTLSCTTNAVSSSPVAGSYSVTLCSGLSSPNYTVSYSYGKFTVNPAPLTASVTGSQTYGGTNIVYVPSYSGLVGADTSTVVTGTLSCTASAASGSPVAGSYSVTLCSGLSSPNYTVSYSYGKFTVNPAPLTAHVTGSQTYGGTNIVYVPSYSGLVGTDTSTVVTGTLSCTANAASGSPVLGNYSVTLCSGLSSPNYTVGYSYGKFTVNPAPLTANVTGSQTYGTAVQSFATTLVGLVNGDSSIVVTGSLTGCSASATPTTDVGNHAGLIAGCGGLTAANYTINYVLGTFTVYPAPQSITFSPLSSQSFGVADFQVTATASSGLPVTFTASGNCSVTPAGLVHLTATGSCTITASQSGSLDYLAATPVPQPFSITAIDFTTLLSVGYPRVVTSATTTSISMTTDTGQTSAAWLPAMQAVRNGFSTQFSFQISHGTTPAIADGFAFVIQGVGTGALGTTGMGGYLGYQGIPNSLAIEFDTFQNGWDPNNNHVAIQSNGTAANTADHTTAAKIAINSGIATNLSAGPHTVNITYDGTTVVVFLDGTQVLSTAVNNLATLLGLTGGNAVVGFTAATGSYSETTQISAWSFSSN